ncbi:MAG: vWA domain-containing protein [Anaerolineae bacterium]
MVRVGGTADLTLTMAFTGCPGGYDGPLHIVLVLDGSSSMAGDAYGLIRQAGRAFIDQLDLTANPTTLVGVVSFNSAAKVLCQLTNASGPAGGCIGRVGASGGNCMACGIKAAIGVLSRGRANVADPDHVREVMVVVSAYYNYDLTGCAPATAAARQATAEGIEVFTMCVARQACHITCMPLAASAPPYHFFVENQAVSAVVARILVELDVRPLRRVVVTDTLGADMTVVAGSVNNAGAPSPDGRAVVWRLTDVAALATELRLSVRVQSNVGVRPTNASAAVTFVDALGATGAFTFPVPSIRVEPSTPTATPRGFRASPTPAPTSTPPDAGDPAPCPRLAARLPRAAIDAAMAEPARIGGWGVPCRAGQPVGPSNPLRRWLDLRNSNQPWHPVFNGVVFKCGCG